MRKTKIIADIGSNYAGSINLAKELIEDIKNCGADIVKFQTFKANDIITKKHSQYKAYKKLELTEAEHKELKEHCEKVGIEFLSTPFSLNTVKMLAELNINYFKIASSQALNIPMLKEMSKYKKPILYSTGMVNNYGLKYILSLFELDTILYCKSVYPCKYDKNTAREIEEIKKLHKKVGLSCHSKNIKDTIKLHKKFNFPVIEKHVRPDNKVDTPDYSHSLTLKQFKNLCGEIANE